MNDEFEEVYRSFYADGATDGLPVVPPMDERVDRMLNGTDLKAETEIGRLGDRDGILRVDTVATNGVMAGCLPIHMPVLIAGARALVAPGSETVEASVGTDSAAQLYLVNGPIRDTLDVNSDTGAFGPGFRSNQTIGRALGLLLQNTARHHPGEQRMGVIGNPFKHSLVTGENEGKSPWPPFHVEHGYDTDASTITLTNVNCFIQCSNYGQNRTPTGILSRLAYNTPPQLGFRPGAVYVISPVNATELADVSKRAVKDYLAENAVVASTSVSAPGRATRTTGADELTDIVRRVHERPEDIEIVVAGGDGAWNAILGPMEGGPTTEVIKRPDRWDDLVADYRPILTRNWGNPRDTT